MMLGPTIQPSSKESPAASEMTPPKPAPVQTVALNEPGDMLDLDDKFDVVTSDNSSDEEFTSTVVPIVNHPVSDSPFQIELKERCKEAIGDGLVPETFRPIQEHLIDGITKKSTSTDDSLGLGDFITVFKPGLFIAAIFIQQPLILKDLPRFLKGLMNFTVQIQHLSSMMISAIPSHLKVIEP